MPMNLLIKTNTGLVSGMGVIPTIPATSFALHTCEFPEPHFFLVMASDPTTSELGRLVEDEGQTVIAQIETDAHGGEGLTRVIPLKRAAFSNSPKPGILEARGEHCQRLGEWVRPCGVSSESGRL